MTLRRMMISTVSVCVRVFQKCLNYFFVKSILFSSRKVFTPNEFVHLDLMFDLHDVVTISIKTSHHITSWMITQLQINLSLCRSTQTIIKMIHYTLTTLQLVTYLMILRLISTITPLLSYTKKIYYTLTHSITYVIRISLYWSPKNFK